MSQRRRALVAQRRRRARQIMVAAPVVLVLLVAVVVLTRSSGEGAGVRVAMREYSFEPDPIVAEDGVVDLVNEGEIAHNFVVPELGKGSLELPPAGSQTLDLSDQPAGTYRAICDLTGHLEAGMETELRLG